MSTTRTGMVDAAGGAGYGAGRRGTHVRISIILAIVVVVPLSVVHRLNSQAKPINTSLSDITGNTLLEYCSGDDIGGRNVCIGYIEGVRDEHTVSSAAENLKFVIPSEVSGEQMKDVVIKFLKEHPERRHKHGAVLVVDALAGAFPAKP
jgi:hypothetical protein